MDSREQRSHEIRAKNSALGRSQALKRGGLKSTVDLKKIKLPQKYLNNILVFVEIIISLLSLVCC